MSAGSKEWSINQAFLPAPSGPNTPFGSPELIVVDSLRVIVLALGVITIISTVIACTRVRTAGQFTRFGTMALFMLTAMLTEFDHIGDYAHYRLYLHIIATVGAAWGMFSFFRFEDPTEVKPEPDKRRKKDIT